MKLGVVFPQIELRGDPHAALQFALAVEELGYDHLIVYDHVVGAQHADRDPPLTGPYTEKDPFHDPFTLLTFVAAKTSRIELATGILILPQRQTVLVAKQGLDLALFSDYRFRMAVGTGWNWVEYESLGQDFKSRGVRMDEQIPLLRRLWSEELVTHHGRFEHIERAGLVIRPKRSIPIWMGGSTEPAFRRAATLGDGFIFVGGPEGDAEQWRAVQRHLRAAGREDAEFGRELIARNPSSSMADLASALLRWRDQGHTHGAVVTMRRNFRAVDEHIDFLAAFRHVMR